MLTGQTKTGLYIINIDGALLCPLYLISIRTGVWGHGIWLVLSWTCLWWSDKVRPLENFFGQSGHGIPEASWKFIFGSVTMSNNLRMNGSLTTFEKLISWDLRTCIFNVTMLENALSWHNWHLCWCFSIPCSSDKWSSIVRIMCFLLFSQYSQIFSHQRNWHNKCRAI